MAFILFSPMGLIGLGERLLAPFRRNAEDARGDGGARQAAAQPRAAAVPQALEPARAAATRCSPAEASRKRFGGFAAVDGVDLEVARRAACRR